jgi:prepilin-type processing-associated H-X9-DG protein
VNGQGYGNLWDRWDTEDEFQPIIATTGYPRTHSNNSGPYSSSYSIPPNTFQVRPSPFQSITCDPTLPTTYHTSGMNVAMADGSVRPVAASISFATWSAAITPSGGEVLGADW